MKTKFSNFTIAISIIAIAGCSSQKNQVSNNEPQPTNQNTQRRGGGQGGGQRQGPPKFSELLSQMDTNSDGKLAKSEVKGRLAENFDEVDANGDGFITETEMENAPRPQRGQRN